MSINVAIVGCGPRGLSALESLFRYQAKIKDSISFKVTIFEPSTNPGAGPVWNLQQSDSNWMNISDRALQNLNGRPTMRFKDFNIPSFPSYHEWELNSTESNTNNKEGIDHFPPRSKMGHYLSERFQSIAESLIKHDVLQFIKSKITRVYCEQETIMLCDSESNITSFNECLLTIGHQPTHLSKQISKWKNKSEKLNIKLIIEPYNETLYRTIAHDEYVAIRGFGLATLDIIRLLTIKRGANFESTDSSEYELTYIPSKNSIEHIVPFSLDGLPPVPKPVGIEVDKLFTPNKNQIRRFTQNIKKSILKEEKPTSTDFLINYFAEICAEIYTHLDNKSKVTTLTKGTVESLIQQWLKDMQMKHWLILDTDLAIEDYMRKVVKMAIGIEDISLDYCIGQVWRHVQPTIYKEFSYSGLPDNLISEIISLDESTKRYSFGPPVESVAQLIALSTAGILNLNFLNNPNIVVSEKGWKLKLKNKSTTTHTMIDSVLDPPKLLNINSKIIENLLKDDLLSPVTSDLGVETKKDGLVVLAKANEKVNLTMLGRNCKGSVVGVDAILECFGPRIDDWAQGLIKRIHSKVNNL